MKMLKMMAIVFLVLLCGAVTTVNAQQSTSGPEPPPGTDRGWIEPSRSQITISGVPKYLWHHGCGPTAVGMVVGYWDGQGADDLVAGDASTQTAAADAMMTDDEGNPVCGGVEYNHYQDYSCPLDAYPMMNPDRSEFGTTHTDNCVGDFMYTSQSAYSNYYGWSWFSHVPRSFTEYVDLVSPGRNPQATNRTYYSGLWDIYKQEIDEGRPVVLLVDTDGDGGTDHFVTGIGYDDVTNKYAIHDTWDLSVHWYSWRQIGNGTWSIYGITTFGLITEPAVEAISPDQNQIDVPADTDISMSFNIGMDVGSFTGSTFFAYGSLTGLHSGSFGYDSPTRTVTFDPDDDFAAGEMVTVIITDGIQSSLGLSPSAGIAWTFIVGTDGGGVFVHIGDLATAVGPMEIRAADFNDDGYIDLATVGTHHVSVFMGQGAGDFAEAADYIIDPLYGFGIAPGDIDNDGDIDLALTLRDSELTFFVQILLNNGDGTFVLSVLYPATGSAGIPILIDVNVDGSLDLVKLNNWVEMAGVYINNGDGTLAEQAVYPAPPSATALCAGDIDNDYDFDLAVTSNQTDDISTLANNGDGSFAAAISHSNAWNGYDICAVDFNGDGYLDLANAAEDGEYMGYVHVLLNNGDASFDLDQSQYVGGSAINFVYGDMDGDGDIDLSLGSEVEQVYLLINTGDGSFTTPDEFPPSAFPYPICAADFNNDGTLDLAKLTYDDDSVRIYLNFDYLCGDANGDLAINVGDAVKIINYVFKGDVPPDPLESANVNCDENVNVGDAVYLINYVFKNGDLPCAGCPQ